MKKNLFIFHCPICGKEIRRETDKDTLLIADYFESNEQSNADFLMRRKCCHLESDGINRSFKKEYYYRLKLTLYTPNNLPKSIYVDNFKLLGDTASGYTCPQDYFFWGLDKVEHLNELPLLKLTEADYFAELVAESLKRYEKCGLKLQEGFNKIDVFYEKWYTYWETAEYICDEFKDTVVEEPGFTEIEESTYVKTINYQVKEIIEWDEKVE